MHLERLDAWIGFVVTTTDTKEGRNGRRQTLFPTLYGRYLRRVVAGILKVVWKAVKGVNTAEFDNDGMRDEVEGQCVGTSRE